MLSILAKHWTALSTCTTGQLTPQGSASLGRGCLTPGPGSHVINGADVWCGGGQGWHQSEKLTQCGHWVGCVFPQREVGSLRSRCQLSWFLLRLRGRIRSRPLSQPQCCCQSFLSLGLRMHHPSSAFVSTWPSPCVHTPVSRLPPSYEDTRCVVLGLTDPA